MNPTELFRPFEEFRQSTLCPYAKRARVRLVETPYAPGSAAFLQDMAAQLLTLKELEDDALVVAIPTVLLGKTFENYASIFHQVLEELTCQELTDDVFNPGWQLTIHGVRVFAALFSPIYPEDNPRHCGGVDHAYLMLQPDTSFHRHLPRERFTSEERVGIKKAIQESFARAGMPYDPLDTQPPKEAQKYLKPRRVGEPFVDWWNK